MPEIVRFKGARVWRRPLLAPAKKRQHPQKTLELVRGEERYQAVFEKQSGVWVVVTVPRCLTWLRGLRANDFRVTVEGEGFEWRWL